MTAPLYDAQTLQAIFPDAPPPVLHAAVAALGDVAPWWRRVAAIALRNQARVLRAMQCAGLAEHHLGWSSGYALGDPGREKVDEIFARALGAEAALVRQQIVSGTHAIALALFAVLRPGDELVSATGRPYDSLFPVIGGARGSLAEWGVTYREVPLDPSGRPDLDALRRAITPRTRVVFIQRSRGYALRPSLTVRSIARVVQVVRSAGGHAVCVVDNCYGEFCEEEEPVAAGADLICGSLIKNPGGGLAPTGGYVAGRRDLVEAAAARLTAPGIGGEVGPTLGVNRLFLQGLFLAPHVVGEALAGAHFVSAFFARLGMRVDPPYDQARTDLIQAVELGSASAMLAFCEAVQAASPVDASALPRPEAMPGYADPVIMAAGTFVQGASMELSADGPLRPPYAVYFQGGLTREHVILAALRAAAALWQRGLIPAAGGNGTGPEAVRPSP